MRRNNGISKKEKKWAHKRGFLSWSVEAYGINDMNKDAYVSDVEMTYLRPINNAYEKWLSDRLTPFYILGDYREYFPKAYCNIISRGNEKVYISLGDKKTGISNFDELMEKARQEKNILLVPYYSANRKDTLHLECYYEKILLNDKVVVEEELRTIIEISEIDYIVTEYTESAAEVKEHFANQDVEIVINMYVSKENCASVLCAYAETGKNILLANSKTQNKDRKIWVPEQISIDKKSGSFYGVLCGKEISGTINEWNDIIAKICEIAENISQIEYMSIRVKLTEDGLKITGHDPTARLPVRQTHDSDMNKFLKERAKEKIESLKKEKNSLGEIIKNRCFALAKKHLFRKGFRDYMLATWLNMVKDDFFNTKSTTLRQKIWAWKRGFPSYRIEQYSLTEKNYKKILSDYEYAWLNRINNNYQIWINDKLSLRYVLEPLKGYLAEYYYYVGERQGDVHIKRLQDCPFGLNESVEDIITLLKMKKKLVFKPNAGAHGDGFYKLEMNEGTLYINDKEKTQEDLEQILIGQKSTYIVTDYLEMHDKMKEIYAGSVNTIRVMLINNSCFDPQIVQTYMRVGSSRTGVTDNIAYGGLAVYVDKETGYYDRAGLLKDHKYYPTDKHPDTGTDLTGYLPNWEIVKEGIIEIAKRMPQLEYLGFDTVITEDGFKILEINIHQDIHKAHEFDDVVNDFFRKKIEEKLKKIEEN